jgi:hypothetical protein
MSELPALDFSREDVEWFRREARAMGVPIHPPSSHALRAIEDFIDAAERNSSVTPQMVIGAASMVPVCKVARLISRDAPHLVPTMWDLLKADTRWALPLRRSRQRDRMWEIVVAGAMLRGFRDVSLSEPDVTAQLREATWGVACKVLHAKNPETARKRVFEGIDQIERSPVRAGAVVLNVTNVIPHDPIWHSIQLGSALTAGSLGEVLATFVRMVAEGTCSPGFVEKLTKDRAGGRRTKVRAVIFVGQCVASTDAGLRVHTFQRSHTIRTLEAPGQSFANRLHLGWKDV